MTNRVISYLTQIVTIRAVRCGVLAIALVAGGCISLGGDAAPLVEHVHAIGPVSVKAPQSPPTQTLAVHVFRARKRFDERLLREDPDGRIAVLESERWAENPADAATDAVREALAGSGLFAGVFPSAEGAKSTRALHGYVLAFQVVKRESGPWTAVFRVRLDLVDAKSGALVRSGVYEGSGALPRPSIEGVGSSMGKAVEAAVSSAVADWLASDVLK